MTIAIDIRSLLSGKISGVETYVTQMVHHLLQHDPQTRYILWMNASNTTENQEKIQTIFSQFSAPNCVKVATHIPNRVLNLTLMVWKRPRLDLLIQKACGEKPDLLFVPDLRPAATKKAKMVLTIHDLAFLHYPHFFSWKTRLWYRCIQPKKLIQRFHHIMTVSKSTQQDVLEQYGPRKNISTVYEGAPVDCKPEVITDEIQKKYGLPERYFLFLATLEPRKNIKNTLRGFEIFSKKHPEENIALVLAGQTNPSVFAYSQKNEKTLSAAEVGDSALAGNKNSGNIILPGFIQEEDKAAVFSGAVAFLYPSLLEGFGLPLVEAMACHTPIITSNRSAMPEVAGEAALLIDPESPEEIATAMEEVLSPGVQQTLRKKSAERAKLFSWNKAAQKTVRLFRHMV